MTEPFLSCPALFNVLFAQKQQGRFIVDVKRRVDDYFRRTGFSKKANTQMRLKTGFFVVGWLVLYILLMAGELSEPVMLVNTMLLGIFLTGIGFNIGHDALHGAYSSSRRINEWAGFAFEILGANAYTWKIRHNLIHHTYTNIMGSDGDLESMPLLRFCVKPGRRWYHRYQNWYAPLLYCFVTLVWVTKKDFKHIFEERREQRLNRRPPKRVYLTLILWKIAHFTVFLGLPLLILPVAWWKIVLGFVVMHFVAGFFMSMVFQLGHEVEGTDFLSQPVGGVMADSWAVHQMKTTANFGNDRLTTWMCGGLNYQIEHHLFPSICHVHYPVLAKIVQQAAKDHHLPYHEHRNIFYAVRSHFRMLKYFGCTDPVALPA